MRAAMTASPSNYVEGIVTAATATSVTIKFVTSGIEGTMTYQRSELLSVTKGTGEAPATTKPAAPAATA